MSVEEMWREDSFVPREDRLTEPLSAEAKTAVVGHPERFRHGDVVRLGDERLEWTGEYNEFGDEIMRSLCEAATVAAVKDGCLHLFRATGAAPAQEVGVGERILILGAAL